MNRICVFIALIGIILTGCDSSLVQQRYQLQTTTDGKVYRLDTKSGDVCYITPKSIFTLGKGTQKLTVGQYLEKEDGKYLKYLGNGKFEPSKYAILNVE